MKITYMIGNGFDISLGLNTRYSDFYKYLENNKENNKENNIIQKLLEDNKNNSDLWSDLELALGMYTNHIENDENKLEKFFNDKYALDTELRKFLKSEEDKIDWGNSNMKPNRERFLYHLEEFYMFLKGTDRKDISKIKNNQKFLPDIISFNYTNTIKNFLVQSCHDQNKLLQLHGNLDENTILGVNDIEQLENAFFKDNDEMLISMCKLETNKYLGNSLINQADTMLRASNIVCIFGMSLGATDKYWWNKIISYLKEGLIKMIVIFHHDPNLDILNLVQRLKVEKALKKKLLNYFSNDEKIQIDLQDKIKVLCNSKILTFDLKFKDDDLNTNNISEKELVEV